MYAINRFQNTERSRYISRLRQAGRYELASDSTLILYVMADWTGKGTGARRPQEKQIESQIVFAFDSTDNMLKLRKKSLIQEGNDTNANADEELLFTLIPKQ